MSMSTQVPHEHYDPTDAHHSHGGVGKYLAVFVALCILTAISFGVANSPIMDAPAAGWSIMMAVSCAKALLVIAFFMHLLWEANWKYVLTIPASIMSMFLVLMLVPDIGFRTRHYSEERLLWAAPPREKTEDKAHADKLPFTREEAKQPHAHSHDAHTAKPGAH